MSSPSRKRIFVVISACTAALLGTAAGIGGFTFVYANGASYLSNRPEACASCHVMREVLQDWRSGDHHHTAVCNDCHVPADPVGKWLTKAINGVHHSYAFTFTDTPVAIRASSLSQSVVQDNCVRCHGALFPGHAAFDPRLSQDGAATKPPACVACHQQVGHWH